MQMVFLINKNTKRVTFSAYTSIMFSM